MTTGFGKLGAWAGIVFAVLFVLAVLMGPANLPDGTDAQVVTFYADSGNRLQSIASGYLFAVAAMCYLVFMLDLRSRFQRSGQDGGNWSSAATVSGAIFLAVLVVAGAAFATIAGDIAFGDDPHPVVPDLARFLPELGYVLLLLGGMVVASAHVASTSMAGLRSGVLPRWLCIAGFVAAFLLLGGVLLVPLIALPLWALAASIVLLTRKAPGTS